MKYGVKVILACLVFIALIFIQNYLFQPRDMLLENWSVHQGSEESSTTYVTLPDIHPVEESGLWYYSTKFIDGSNEIDALHIPRMNGYTFTVLLNDTKIYQQGDFTHPTA